MDYTPANTRKGAWDVTWNSVAIGAVDEVDPTGLMIKLDEIKVGSMGDTVLGRRIIGLEGVIKVQMREIVVANLQALMPWWSSGAIALNPAANNVDVYTYAELLNLHPQEEGASTALDINLLKVFPKIPVGWKRDGNNNELISIEFEPYPDRDQFPLKVYGYVGAVPA
jgi:hypothetical protein